MCTRAAASLQSHTWSCLAWRPQRWSRSLQSPGVQGPTMGLRRGCRCYLVTKCIVLYVDPRIVPSRETKNGRMRRIVAVDIHPKGSKKAWTLRAGTAERQRCRPPISGSVQVKVLSLKNTGHCNMDVGHTTGCSLEGRKGAWRLALSAMWLRVPPGVHRCIKYLGLLSRQNYRRLLVVPALIHILPCIPLAWCCPQRCGDEVFEV